jgi:hypothetical protein
MVNRIKDCFAPAGLAMTVVFAMTLSISVASADIVVEPKDMEAILKKVSAKEEQVPAGGSAARIVIKDDRIIFVPKPGIMDVSISFADKSPTIIKQVMLKNSATGDDFAFEAVLKNANQPFKHEIKQVNGQDALVFFNDVDILVYTQTAAPNGAIQLKEWVYARKPNSPRGSEWTWTFDSAQGQWPLSLGLGNSGEAQVYRNMPITGVPIEGKARMQYVMNAMVKIVQNEPVDRRFPFHEIVSAIPPSQYWTNEGIIRQASIGVSNANVLPHIKPGEDPNIFTTWDHYWQSYFKVAVPAQPQEYPLLIDPTLVLDSELLRVSGMRTRLRGNDGKGNGNDSSGQRE